MLVILGRENNHKHGGYLGSGGTGLTSIDGKDKHQHVLTFRDDELDADTGEIITPGGWIVEAAGDKPHTHPIEEIERVAPKKERKSDDERISEVLALVREADANEGESIRNGKESYKFYMGEQWDSGQKARLEAQRRAVITVNEIALKVDTLCGTHDQNKTDVIFRPVEDGDTQAADIANMLYKDVMNRNNFHGEESNVFRDTVVAGRGDKNIEIDFNDNIEGDIKIRWFPWDKARFGPHERVDQSDMEYLVKFDNFSIGKLQKLFPKKAKELEASFRSFEDPTTIVGGFEEPHKRVAGFAYRLDQKEITKFLFDGQPVVDVQRKEFKVFELWQKIFRNIEGLIFAEDNFVEDGEGIKESDLNMLKRIPGMSSIQRTVFDIRKTEVAGHVLLSDELLDLPVNANEFHLISTYAKKHKDKFEGKVEQTKGVQLTINKSFSQIIDVTNKNASYGWFYDGDTFENEQQADVFRRTSATAGFLQKVKDTGRIPVQTQGVKFPNELLNLKEIASQGLEEMMGIPPKANDFSGDFTAKLHLLTKRQSLVGNDYLFENAHNSNKRMARLVIAYIQHLYTPERVMRIISSQTEEDINQLNDPNVINVTIEEVAQMLANEDLLNLDLVMSEASHTQTMKELTFMAMQEVMQTIGGDPTILRHWIKNSNFPNANQILSEMDAQQQAAAEASSNTNDSQNYAALPDSVKEFLATQGVFSHQDLAERRDLNQQQIQNQVAQ